MAKFIFKTTNAGLDTGEAENVFLGGGNGNWAATVEISVEIDLPRFQAISLLGAVPSLSLSYYRDTCSSLLVTAFNTIVMEGAQISIF